MKIKNEISSLIDISESVFMRKIEAQMCLERIARTEKKWNNLIQISSNTHSNQQTGGNSSEIDLIERGAIALRKIKELMELNKEKLDRIE